MGANRGGISSYCIYIYTFFVFLYPFESVTNGGKDSLAELYCRCDRLKESNPSWAEMKNKGCGVCMPLTCLPGRNIFCLVPGDDIYIYMDKTYCWRNLPLYVQSSMLLYFSAFVFSVYRYIILIVVLIAV